MVSKYLWRPSRIQEYSEGKTEENLLHLSNWSQWREEKPMSIMFSVLRRRYTRLQIIMILAGRLKILSRVGVHPWTEGYLKLCSTGESCGYLKTCLRKFEVRVCHKMYKILYDTVVVMGQICQNFSDHGMTPVPYLIRKQIYQPRWF